MERWGWVGKWRRRKDRTGSAVGACQDNFSIQNLARDRFNLLVQDPRCNSDENDPQARLCKSNIPDFPSLEKDIKYI